ncbi:SET domain-containing protein [Artemisia annua]|uniref:SET domain-containing protein n=1 Tax=Artemisia annua TaxID=35608 RepID=A0A2U1L084_ARTAN|nr:SET domain-containing protein [Artemisia annua]
MMFDLVVAVVVLNDGFGGGDRLDGGGGRRGGGGLFASKPIQAGDCILKIPRSAHLTADNLHPSVSSLLGEFVDDGVKLALAVLLHQNLGQASEWAPYISCLPRVEEMHSTELEMEIEALEAILMDVFEPNTIDLVDPSELLVLSEHLPDLVDKAINVSIHLFSAA